MKPVTVYKCELSNETFSTPEEAIAREQELAAKRQLLIDDVTFKFMFPQQHPKDNEHIYHCVRCGTKLIELNKKQKNKLTYLKEGISFIFNGRYCPDCGTLVEKLVKHVLSVNSHLFT